MSMPERWMEIRPCRITVVDVKTMVGRLVDGFSLFSGNSMLEVRELPPGVPVEAELSLTVIREFGPCLDDQKLAVLRACLLEMV